MFNFNNIEIEDYLPKFYKVLKETGHCYIMTNHKNLTHFLKVIDEWRDPDTKQGFSFIKSLIWDKGNKIMGQYYMSQFEYILFLRKGAGKKINNWRKYIMELTVNLENLSDDERKNLMALVEKSVKPKSKVWKPKGGEGYYYICTDSFNTDFALWSDLNFDERQWKYNNCFKTEEEAEFALQHRLVEVELQRFALEHNEGEIDCNDSFSCYFFICYDYDNSQIMIDNYGRVRYDKVYFTAKKIAQAAIDTIGEERLIKYYFGIKN